jgi:hypothetical protein
MLDNVAAVDALCRHGANIIAATLFDGSEWANFR